MNDIMNDIEILLNFLNYYKKEHPSDVIVEERSCPNCCPDGDDPDWDYCISSDGSVSCAYSDCQKALTPIHRVKPVLESLDRIEKVLK